MHMIIIHNDSAAPVRADTCLLPPIFTMEDNNHCTATDTKAGYVPLLPVSQEVVSPDLQERSSSLVQVKPEPPHIKEEQEQVLLQRPEDTDGSSFTLHGVIYGSGYVLHVENAEFLQLPVCKEEACPENERTSSLVKEVPEIPQIKYEKEELLQRPEEVGGSMLTLLAVKSEDHDENRETEPLASTSTQHMTTQAVRDRGASQSASDDLSSNSSESNIENSDENWEETTEGLSVVNTRKSHRKQAENSRTTQLPCDDHQARTSSHSSEESDTEDSEEDWEKTEKDLSVLNTQKSNKEQTSISEKLFKDLTSSKTTPSLRSYTGKRLYFNCAICRKCFENRSTLRQHVRTHAGQKSFSCTNCDRSFTSKAAVKRHMHAHTKENPYSYSYKYLSID